MKHAVEAWHAARYASRSITGGKTKMRKSRLLLLATVAITLPLYARDGAGDRPVIPRAGATVEVSLVNVDVVVTDRKGNHVQGLTKDDFEIYEDRQLQPVSNFSEYQGGREATAADGTVAARPKRTILVFIDHFMLLPQRQHIFFESLKTLLHSTIGPGDVVSVVSWKGMVVTRLPFTSDLAKLDAVLGKLDKESSGFLPVEGDLLWREEAMSVAGAQGFKINYRDLEGQSGKDLAFFEAMEMRKKIREIQSLVTGISGFEGRKVLLLAASHLSGVVGGVGRTTRDDDYSTYASIQSLARIAATNNVTIYPLYPTGLATDMVSAEHVRSFNGGGHAQETLYSTLGSMYPIAEQTGGVVSWGVENIADFLPQLRTDLDSYYSLAYRATARGSGADRSIVVRMKNHDYTARARRDYVDKSPEGKMKDRVIASLFQEPAGAKIPITVAAGAAESQGRRHWHVPIHVQIPINALTTLPEQGEHAGAFSVYVAWGGVLGEVSDATRQTQSFSISDMKAAEAKAGHFEYDLTLDVDDRTQNVVIGVTDEVSQEFGIRKIVLPPRT